jgi:hypothetical protein
MTYSWTPTSPEEGIQEMDRQDFLATLDLLLGKGMILGH